MLSSTYTSAFKVMCPFRCCGWNLVGISHCSTFYKPSLSHTPGPYHTNTNVNKEITKTITM